MTVDDSGIDTERSRELLHRVASLLDSALRELHEPKEAAQGAILEAASLLQRQIGPAVSREVFERKGRLLAWQVRKVRDYVDQHITRRVLVADLSMLIQRSEAHFSRAFRRTFGVSPHAYVIRRRLRFASEYMQLTEKPLSEIANLCGFVDQAHLCKHFRQATGRTPAAWRRARKAHETSASLEGIAPL